MSKAKVEITHINTNSQHAYTVEQDTVAQNKANQSLYSPAQQKAADKLARRLARTFNVESYVNLRERFIAVKLQSALSKMTARRFEALVAEVHKNNAELVFTATDGIILRLR